MKSVDTRTDLQTDDPRRWIGELCVALQREGTCYPTPTLWRGVPALRFSIVNASTSERRCVGWPPPAP